MKNNLLFSFFTFLSFLGKNIIECFIPIILYNNHYNINQIFIYLLIQYIFSIIFLLIIPKIKNKYKIKSLILINVLFYILTYLIFYYIYNNIYKLILVSIFYAAHSTIYWVLRHSYIIDIYQKDNMSKYMGNILIITEISFIISSIIGTYLLDKSNNLLLLIISSILLIISNIFLYKIKLEDDKNNYIDFSILKKLDNTNILFFIIEQFKVLAITIFPLYIYIYLNTNYKFIGILNIVISISSIIVLFIYSRIMNKKKKSYLYIVAPIYFLLWILKINIKIKLLVIIITFIEGISAKIYQLIISRFLYAIGKYYNAFNYSIITEILFSFIRFIIIVIYLIFIKDLKTFIIICSLFLLASGFIKIKD